MWITVLIDLIHSNRLRLRTVVVGEALEGLAREAVSDQGPHLQREWVPDVSGIVPDQVRRGHAASHASQLGIRAFPQTKVDLWGVLASFYPPFASSSFSSSLIQSTDPPEKVEARFSSPLALTNAT